MPLHNLLDIAFVYNNILMILVVFFKHTLVNIFYLTIFLGLAVLFCYFAVSSPIDIPVLHFEKCSGGNLPLSRCSLALAVGRRLGLMTGLVAQPHST